MAIVLMLGVVVVVLAVAVALWWFSADQVARRAMLQTPRSAIADAQDGQVVRVVGVVEAEATVEAPISGRPCVAWRVKVEEKQRSNNGTRWDTVIDDHDEVAFSVVEGDARALVRPLRVHAVLEQDGHATSGFLDDATPRLEAFLAARGRSSTGLVFNRTMRYREGVVEPGELVAVVATARWERDPDRGPRAGDGYRDAKLPQRLVLEAPPGEDLLVSDEPSMLR